MFKLVIDGNILITDNEIKLIIAINLSWGNEVFIKKYINKHKPITAKTSSNNLGKAARIF